MAQESTSQDGVQPLLALFDLSEQGFAWRAPRPDQIRERRAVMDDKLLFDNLLISGGVRDPDFIYPPDDVAGLTRLLSAIDSSTFDALKKQTLVYFLLKWEHDGGLKADQFKLDCCIPPQFSALADAYWHLDTGLNIGKAISILSDSRVRREYASKIIQAITLSDQPSLLLRKYVRTAKPALVHPPDLIRYTLALAESSLVEAWQFQRTFAETDEVRPHLFKRILDWVIYPTPQPKALKELISLPLSRFEESILNDHAVKPPQEYSTAAIARLQDLVCVRYIELGKYAEAIKMDRKFSSTAYDGKESLDRRNMIKDLYDALPPVEKSLIDMPIQIEKPKPREPPSNGDVSMSQSWEEVRVPDSLNKSTSTPLRNIQIPSAPAPRFTIPAGNQEKPLSVSASAPPTPAPILPISSTNAVASQSAFTPRKTAVGKAPAPTPPSTSLLGGTKAPLSGVGQRLAAGTVGVSSPASGITLPARGTPIARGAPAPEFIKAAAAAAIPPAPPVGVPGPSSTQPVFTNTAKQANAFFQPKPKSSSTAVAPAIPSETTPSTQKRPFDKVDQSPERKKTASPIRPLEAEDTMLIDDVPPVQEKRARHGPAEDEAKPANEKPSISRGGLSEDEAHVMDESIFAPEKTRSRGPSSRTSQARNVSGRRSKVPESISAPKPVETASAKLRARKQPPGAFDNDAMDEDSAQEESEGESVAQAAPPGKRRGSVQPRSVSAKGKESTRLSLPAKSTRGRPSTSSRKSKADEEEEPRKRRFPGGLSMQSANDDHDSEHDQHGTSGEEEDVVPPLPDPSPMKVTASKRPIRRTRSIASAAASDTGDDEGGTSRRRSSRLTTAGSSINLSPEKAESITAPKSIKKSRSSTTKSSKRK